MRGCVVYPAEQISHAQCQARQRRAQDNPIRSPRRSRSSVSCWPRRLVYSVSSRHGARPTARLCTAAALDDTCSYSRPAEQEAALVSNAEWQSDKRRDRRCVGCCGHENLVFVQTTVFCESCVAEFPARLDSPRGHADRRRGEVARASCGGNGRRRTLLFEGR